MNHEDLPKCVFSFRYFHLTMMKEMIFRVPQDHFRQHACLGFEISGRHFHVTGHFRHCPCSRERCGGEQSRGWVVFRQKCWDGSWKRTISTNLRVHWKHFAAQTPRLKLNWPAPTWLNFTAFMTIGFHVSKANFSVHLR